MLQLYYTPSKKDSIILGDGALMTYSPAIQGEFAIGWNGEDYKQAVIGYYNCMSPEGEFVIEAIETHRTQKAILFESPIQFDRLRVFGIK